MVSSVNGGTGGRIGPVSVKDRIALVMFRAGTHRVGRDNGALQVRTYREGLAQKVGHDLIIDVGQWDAVAEVGEDGALSAVELNAGPHSLQVREGCTASSHLPTRTVPTSAGPSTRRSWEDGRLPSARPRLRPTTVA